MSGKEFFVSRYNELGWIYREIKLTPSIRVNTVNAEEKSIVQRLESQEAILEKIPFVKNGYWVESKFSVGATPEYLLGLYSVQEAAAQIPVTLFRELRNQTVLDACAAPGGKTVQLADLMQNSGAIAALDIDRRRLRALSNQLERCDIRNTVAYQLDARDSSKLNIKFDRILLDMPCSGNYVTDKGWFEKRTLKDVERNAKLQREILSEALKVVKDDGEVIYATCSLEPEENELNINWAIETFRIEIEEIDCPGVKGITDPFSKELDGSIGKCRRIWPETTQGFFVCKLRKRTGSS